MSIHFISGKPGSGKTMYSMRLIADELQMSKRHIFTNVPVRLGELNEWMQKQGYPQADPVGRIHFLDDDTAGEFWCHRPEWKSKPVGKQGWDNGDRPDYSGVHDNGVLYVIDEVQNFFSARRWSMTGPDVLYYMSQHRKLGDTVICITQAPMLVETQFRCLAQDFCIIKNMGKLTIMGMKMPKVFIRELRNTASEQALTMETKFAKMDAALANCYDTAAGVGIHGRNADLNERRHGVPWYVVVPLVVAAIIVAVLFVPRLFANLITAPMRHAQGAGVARSNLILPAPSSQGAVEKTRAEGSQMPSSMTNVLRVTGFTKLGQIWNVCLSDGRVLHTGDYALVGVVGDQVNVDGKWLKLP